MGPVSGRLQSCCCTRQAFPRGVCGFAVPAAPARLSVILFESCFACVQSQRVPTVKNGFKQGMKLEGIDPQHPSMYFVLTVAEVSQASINSVNGSKWLDYLGLEITHRLLCLHYGFTVHFTRTTL